MRYDRLVPMIALVLLLGCSTAPPALTFGQEPAVSFHAYYEAEESGLSAVPTVDFFDNQIKYSMSNLSKQERLQSEFGAVFAIAKKPDYKFLDFRSHIMPIFGITTDIRTFQEHNYSCTVSGVSGGRKELECRSESGRVYRSTYDSVRGVTYFEWSCGASSFKQCRYLLKSDYGIFASSAK